MPVVNVAPRLSHHHLPHNKTPYYLLPSSSSPTVPRRSRFTHHRSLEFSRFLLRATCCYTTGGSPPNSSSPDNFPRRHQFDDDFFTNFHSSSSSSAASDFFHDHSPIMTSLPASSTSTTTTTQTTRFRPSKLDLLEPSLLGIRTDPPDWPERDEMIRFRIARRASCVELPISLRMIKKKKLPATKIQQGGGGGVDRREALSGIGISKAFSSTVSVVRELQTHALRLRGLAIDEQVENKVENEMKSSFVWLFREVFSKTPDLMLDVMKLTVDFASTSMENNLTTTTTSQEKKEVRTASTKSDDTSASTTLSGLGNATKLKAQTTTTTTRKYHPEVVAVPGESETESNLSTTSVPEVVPRRIEEIMDNTETELWNSMVEEASRILKEEISPAPIGEVIATKRKDELQFVSPVRVEIESDDYAEYERTNLLYQIGILEEPVNALLLSNYAQFLYLVAHDHDRAEEYFQRAIVVDSSDPEIMSQYATFLWIVRKDLWGAEDRYQQAMAIEPENAYYASKYANFLWNTGGDETCYPASG